MYIIFEKYGFLILKVWILWADLHRLMFEGSFRGRGTLGHPVLQISGNEKDIVILIRAVRNAN